MFQDTDDADKLQGGDGDDTLLMGCDDVGIGGEGDDIFAAGDFTGGFPAIVQDYTAEDDAIRLYYKEPDGGGDIPDVELFIVDGDTEIRMDGALVMVVQGVELDGSEIELEAYPDTIPLPPAPAPAPVI